MTASWWSGRALAFDLETTSAEPREARIVSAHISEIGPAGAEVLGNWLVNPGVPIPADATAIHGITDEIAATGYTTAEVMPQIVETLGKGWARGLPVIIMVANYDLTVVECELTRLRQVESMLMIGPVLDPFVIDRGIDPYRAGKRNLAALAKHYRVKQEAAHSAAGDALCAARIVWRMASMPPSKRLPDLSLAQMQLWQRKSHFDRQTNYEEYCLAEGKPEKVDKEWPVRSMDARDPADYRMPDSIPE